MQLAPRSWWRPLILVGVGSLLIWYLAHLGTYPQRVYDNAKRLSPYDSKQLNGLLAAVMNEAGVDIRIVIDSAPQDTALSRLGLQVARRLGIGRSSSTRGLLLYYAVNTRQLRFEVGRHMEGLFPDAFLGYVLRGHTDAYLADTGLTLAFQSTITMLHYRIREALLRREFDPATVSDVVDSSMLMVGGGVTTDLEGTLAQRLRPVRDSEVERFLGPGATPDETLRRYLTWLRLPAYLPRVGLFTPQSQIYMTNLGMTPGFLAYLRYIQLGKHFTVVTRGDRAVAICPDDPLVQPHYFVRANEGWQMDIPAEIRNTSNLVGTDFAWTLLRSGDAYDRAFEDLIEEYPPFWRFTIGDNTPLPIRGRVD